MAEPYQDTPMIPQYGVDLSGSYEGGYIPQPGAAKATVQTAAPEAPSVSAPAGQDYITSMLPMLHEQATSVARGEVAQKAAEARGQYEEAQAHAETASTMAAALGMIATNSARHAGDVQRQLGFEKIRNSRYGHYAARETGAASDEFARHATAAIMMGEQAGQARGAAAKAKVMADYFADPKTLENETAAAYGKYLPEVMRATLTEHDRQMTQDAERRREQMRLDAEAPLRAAQTAYYQQKAETGGGATARGTYTTANREADEKELDRIMSEQAQTEFMIGQATQDVSAHDKPSERTSGNALMALTRRRQSLSDQEKTLRARLGQSQAGGAPSAPTQYLPFHVDISDPSNYTATPAAPAAKAQPVATPGAAQNKPATAAVPAPPEQVVQAYMQKHGVTHEVAVQTLQATYQKMSGGQ